MSKIKVYLAGYDGIGWAMDDDIKTTKTALLELQDTVEVVESISDSDVVHCVWGGGLSVYPDHQLKGKRILCHVENEVGWLWRQPHMINTVSKVGLWLAVNQQAVTDLKDLNYKVEYLPYTIDTDVFFPIDAIDPKLEKVRQDWAIPADKYLIGNFMRDTSGLDLNKPKEQKGVEMFLAILLELHKQQMPIHVLLAGPRRHWIKSKLSAEGIPYSFVGRELKDDDNDVNILSRDELNLLFNLLDTYVITSRWEGGPRAVLEAAASRCKIVSTPVGLGPDVLEPKAIFKTFEEGAASIAKDIEHSYLNDTIQCQHDRLLKTHIPGANVSKLRDIYDRIEEIQPFDVPDLDRLKVTGLWPSREAKSSSLIARGKRLVKRISPLQHKPGRGLKISLWHQYFKPPYGGGNQFMMALRDEMKRQGAKVVINSTSKSVNAHLCNGSWFDVEKFERLSRKGKVNILHRVDGPTSLYRGGGDRTIDNQVFDLNARFASATVIQSLWTMKTLSQMGYHAVNPVIIRNAVNANIFNRHGRIDAPKNRKLRIIATAWSDNLHKGAPTYKWLEENLDWDRFEFTFVGRSQIEFERAQHLPAMPSEKLADVLREHDLYITASETETCSNALIEAMACGLPAIYLNDAGHGELVSQGGLPYMEREEILAQLDKIADSYEDYQSMISVTSISEVATQYINAILMIEA